MTDILVVEDDPAVSQMLTLLLHRAGYNVRAVASAAEAESRVRRGVDLLVLDLGLPDRDGLDLCREIREQRPGLPILVVSARTSEPDVVLAMDAGADDYVMKPFRSLEFLARVRAVLRRSASGDVVYAGELMLDAQSLKASVNDQPLALTRKEFEILSMLMRNFGHAVTRDALLAALWRRPLPENSKSLDMHMSSLRRKLADAGASEVVRTLRGVGFRLERQSSK